QARPVRQRTVAPDDDQHEGENQRRHHAQEEGGHDQLPAEEAAGHHHQVGIAQAEGFAAQALTRQEAHTAQQQRADEQTDQPRRRGTEPTSTPTAPGARPSCPEPAGSHAGSGPQTGQGYNPCFSPPAGSAHIQSTGTAGPGRGSASAGVSGHGQGKRTAPVKPTSVPSMVSWIGISRPARSQTAATIRKQNSRAW